MNRNERKVSYDKSIFNWSPLIGPFSFIVVHRNAPPRSSLQLPPFKFGILTRGTDSRERGSRAYHVRTSIFTSIERTASRRRTHSSAHSSLPSLSILAHLQGDAPSSSLATRRKCRCQSITFLLPAAAVVLAVAAVFTAVAMKKPPSVEWRLYVALAQFRINCRLSFRSCIYSMLPDAARVVPRSGITQG
jgi:hypothetical protein